MNKIKGYLNFDMIGRNNDESNPEHVVYFYTAAHPVFGDWLKKDIKQYALNLKPDYRAWDKLVDITKAVFLNMWNLVNEPEF